MVIGFFLFAGLVANLIMQEKAFDHAEKKLKEQKDLAKDKQKYDFQTLVINNATSTYSSFHMPK